VNLDALDNVDSALAMATQAEAEAGTNTAKSMNPKVTKDAILELAPAPTAASIRTLVGSATDSNVFDDADHTKLDAIEASATADQTDAEIKTAYENNSDTNAFTDADHTKLNAVAASANNYVHPNHSGDVVSTADGATVIQVDAVDIPMLSATGTASSTTFLRGDNAWVTPTDTNTTYSVGDGGLTQNNFTNTLKTKLDGIEASATADQTNAEIRAAVEAASDSNVFTDADHTKLNAVPASIDEAGTAVAMAIALG
jgi:hypothetical protein